MNKFKFWRIERGLSQFELEQASGVPRWAIQLIEAGYRMPTENQLAAIAEALGVPSVQFLLPPFQGECISPEVKK